MIITIDYNNDEIRIESESGELDPNATFKLTRGINQYVDIISEILNRCVPKSYVSLVEINEDIRTIREEW